MKRQTFSLTKKVGRPSLAEATKNPYSKENLVATLTRINALPDEAMKQHWESLHEIEDPVERTKALKEFNATYMPYTANKLTSEDAIKAPSITINIKEFKMPEQKVEGPVIDV